MGFRRGPTRPATRWSSSRSRWPTARRDRVVLRSSGPVAHRGRMRLLVADRDHHGGDLPDPDFFTTTVAGERATVALPASAPAPRRGAGRHAEPGPGALVGLRVPARSASVGCPTGPITCMPWISALACRPRARRDLRWPAAPTGSRPPRSTAVDGTAAAGRGPAAWPTSAWRRRVHRRGAEGGASRPTVIAATRGLPTGAATR